MELYNEILEHFIKRKKNKILSIPWDFCFRFVKEIVEALSYLHHDDPTNSFIHGD